MRIALLGLLILCCSAACSQEPAPRAVKQTSRFTQQGMDAASAACGLPRGSVLLDQAYRISLGSAVVSDGKKVNCVLTKIKEAYYVGAKPGVAGSAKSQPEGSNAQTR